MFPAPEPIAGFYSKIDDMAMYDKIGIPAWEHCAANLPRFFTPTKSLSGFEGRRASSMSSSFVELDCLGLEYDCWLHHTTRLSPTR